MIKGIVLTDSHGNWVGLSEDWMRKNVSRNDGMFWADCPSQAYQHGDWVELLFIPSYNGEWSEETQQCEFIPNTFKEGEGTVTVTRHFWHEADLLTNYGRFESGWKEDRPNEIWEERHWQDLEGLTIPILF